MKFILSFLFLTLALFFTAQGQNPTSELRGVVTFITSQNVYVKFDQTQDIQVGDTLASSLSSGPCLLVSNKSSSSCVCVPIQGCEVKKGTEIVFRPKSKNLIEQKEVLEEKEAPLPEDIAAPEIVEEDDLELENKEKIRGRVSLSSYSNIASNRDNRNRFMGRLSLNAQHINNSKLSFQTYLNFRQINPTNPAEFSPQTRYLRVFNLAATYDLRPDLSISIGRKINPKMGSLGAIDGVQAEKRFKNAYIGAVAGARPDIATFNLNPNLLQLGGYVGAQTSQKNFYSQTTLGLIQQQNAGKIDRRYAYFQHSSTIARNLSLFSSMEMDVYSSVNGVTSNSLRLSNIFLSGTYRFGRKANFMLSYDSRKRILYYETFQTEIERLLNDDLARQGVRARLNVRPIKYVNVGLSYGKRFQSDQQNQSDNFHAYASWSKIPAIGGRVSLAYNRNSSNYLTSSILSLRHSRSLVKNKVEADFYYRMANYVFVNSEKKRLQNYIGTNLSFHISKKLTFRIAGEASSFNQESNYRVYARIIRRFYGKKARNVK